MKKSHFVGNVMIDTLLKNKAKGRKFEYPRTAERHRWPYAVLTLASTVQRG